MSTMPTSGLRTAAAPAPERGKKTLPAPAPPFQESGVDVSHFLSPALGMDLLCSVKSPSSSENRTAPWLEPEAKT